MSWRLVGRIEDSFPECVHVSGCDLQNSPDIEIWEFARAKSLHLLSKDDDMNSLVKKYGPPPKLVWLKLGNVSTDQIADALIKSKTPIEEFLASDNDVLAIS